MTGEDSGTPRIVPVIAPDQDDPMLVRKVRQTDLIRAPRDFVVLDDPGDTVPLALTDKEGIPTAKEVFSAGDLRHAVAAVLDPEIGIFFRAPQPPVDHRAGVAACIGRDRVAEKPATFELVTDLLPDTPSRIRLDDDLCRGGVSGEKQRRRRKRKNTHDGKTSELPRRSCGPIDVMLIIYHNYTKVKARSMRALLTNTLPLTPLSAFLQ